MCVAPTARQDRRLSPTFEVAGSPGAAGGRWARDRLASVELTVEENGRQKIVVFSGDLAAWRAFAQRPGSLREG